MVTIKSMIIINHSKNIYLAFFTNFKSMPTLLKRQVTGQTHFGHWISKCQVDFTFRPYYKSGAYVTYLMIRVGPIVYFIVSVKTRHTKWVLMQICHSKNKSLGPPKIQFITNPIFASAYFNFQNYILELNERIFEKKRGQYVNKYKSRFPEERDL